MKCFKKFIGAIILASIILFTASVEAAELVILHTNDFHGRILNTDDRGQSMGLAEMVAAIKTLKAENKNNLWLDAGDTFHGMPDINISKGENMVNLLNIAGLDAMTPGNHDFNYGIPRLIELSKIAKFDILAANLVYRFNDQHVLKPYKIYTLPNGLKVGVIGLPTPETQYKANPALVKDVNFLNPNEIAKDIVKKIRPQCDVVIAVTHLGVLENSEFNSLKLAKEVEGIDLIVDGHSHTVLENGITIGDTLIVQTGAHAYNLGRVTIQIDGKKITAKNAELLNADAVKKINPVPDKEIERAIRKFQVENKKLFNEVIAQNPTALSGEYSSVRLQEMELGDFLTDAFRWKTGADIGVINGGGIRSDLPAGNVTRGDPIAIFPFGNQLQVVEISGVKIREMLEHSVSGYPDTVGGFLQVSGLRFNFYTNNPVGSRISDIFVNNKPLDDDKIYTLATVDFLISGGDGYEMLKKLSIIAKYGTCEEILTDYLQEVGVKKIDTGRIIKH